MDTVANRFGRNREEMREGLDTHYTMEHFETPLATKVGCKLLELKDEDFEFFVTAYERFLDTYLDIISNLMFKDRAIQAARDILPLEVLIEMGFPPAAIF
jgi:hypothetical protein